MFGRKVKGKDRTGKTNSTAISFKIQSVTLYMGLSKRHTGTRCMRDSKYIVILYARKDFSIATDKQSQYNHSFFRQQSPYILLIDMFRLKLGYFQTLEILKTH
jgi:hypothetical protein